MSDITVTTPNLNSITVGKLQAQFSRDGTRILRYFIDFWHNELDLHKDVSAPEIYLLQGKVDALMASWDKKLVEHQKRLSITAGKDAADQATVDAAGRLAAIDRILQHTLAVDDRVSWDTLKDHSPFEGNGGFPEPMPRKEKLSEPEYW